MEKQEQQITNKITSYICSIHISFDLGYVTGLMKQLGFNPETDFEWTDNDKAGHAFQHIRDFISGFDFISNGGHFISLNRTGYYLPWRSAVPLFESFQFKSSVVEKMKQHELFTHWEFPRYLLGAGLNDRKIELFHHDMRDAECYWDVRVIGNFPYQNLIDTLITFHQGYLDAGDERQSEMEKQLICHSDFKNWKMKERYDPGPWKGNYHPDYEEAWHDYELETSYANIALTFEPNWPG